MANKLDIGNQTQGWARGEQRKRDEGITESISRLTNSQAPGTQYGIELFEIAPGRSENMPTRGGIVNKWICQTKNNGGAGIDELTVSYGTIQNLPVAWITIGDPVLMPGPGKSVDFVLTNTGQVSLKVILQWMENPN